MSENSLIVRQKYISKLFDKVESLQEGIQLLEKVDSKIFKKSMSRTIQAGGAAVTNNGISIKGLESEALVTRLKLEQQKGVIEKARTTIDTLNQGLAGVRSSLEQLHKLMQDVNDNIKIDPLGDAQLPDLSSYGKQTLYNAFKNIPYTDMVKVASDNTETLYALLEKAPSVFTEKLTGDKGISSADYSALLARLHGASSSTPGVAPPSISAYTGVNESPSGSAPAPGSSAPAPPGPNNTPSVPGQSGGFFSSFFMPKKMEDSVTSSEMPFTAQNLYSETSNY
jgi:hypothetical protein